MSRFKRFAVGTALTLTVLGGTTMLWYQSHYVAPLVLPPDPPLPSPNGFDTLEQAKDLQCYRLEGKTYFFGRSMPLAMHQKLLAANKPCLEKTREALTQEYLVPRNTNPSYPHSNLRDYYPHSRLALSSRLRPTRNQVT
ncbi:MAG: hypothetical protein QM758_17355 [Armatimonas sp.]